MVYGNSEPSVCSYSNTLQVVTVRGMEFQSTFSIVQILVNISIPFLLLEDWPPCSCVRLVNGIRTLHPFGQIQVRKFLARHQGIVMAVTTKLLGRIFQNSIRVMPCTISFEGTDTTGLRQKEENTMNEYSQNKLYGDLWIIHDSMPVFITE